MIQGAGSWRRSLLAAVAVLVCWVLAGCSLGGGSPDAEPATLPSAATPAADLSDPASDPTLARFYTQRLDWTSCGDGFDCATLTVPLDWSRPAGQTIRLALNRLPASGDRIGALLINPGGPGASGLDYARAARQAFGKAVLSGYDIVGFDPRGVGKSDPVKCVSNAALGSYIASDGTPDDARELARTVQEIRQFAAACERNTGALLAHVDTLSTARDMDVIRAALGQEVLAYYGASYGTLLGAWYAQTFPWRVGRMVLDSAVDPSLTSEQYALGQAEGFARVLRLYLQDCLSQRDCPLRGTVQDAVQQLQQLLAAADSAPLRTDSGRLLTQSMMATAIAQALYAEQLWKLLTVGLTEALAGDGTTLLRLSDLYYQRDDKGQYGQTVVASGAIYCLDSPETRSVVQIRSDALALGREYPPLGDFIGWGALSCAEWPEKPVLRPTRLTAPGAAPILVVGTVNDPATPYEWAQALASQLSSARLLTWEGSQHVAYRKGGDCIDGAVERYLLNGTLPAEGTRCPAG